MAFREVAMFEVKEVIRLFGEGVPKKAIARIVGVDWATSTTSSRQRQLHLPLNCLLLLLRSCRLGSCRCCLLLSGLLALCGLFGPHALAGQVEND